ncbi:hypothetical protein GEV43_34230 [Actinomadura sp. J1-007]|uniref:hypothetical protein n=1 Tax=Actinomadura sp. J1-007 TaxID=2661913 RepID=UPI00132BB0DA|nr:hypothetical protein [Actinomadura sp. J1-007]MWK38598.1 hypothetical protein [Actinomadura sp. J1-007]
MDGDGRADVRVAMWGAWSVLVPVQASALVMHAALSGLVVVLLARAAGGAVSAGPPPVGRRARTVT